MPTFHGIIVYEILENGNLINGIYTNTGLTHPTTGLYYIDNEIASRQTFSGDPIGGTYTCRYIEHGNKKVTECKLLITPQNGVYECVWQTGPNIDWVGIGLMVGKTHFAVSYTAP